MKKSRLINLFYAAAVMLVVGMTVVPSYASDHEYDFEFDFECGNRVTTQTEIKHDRDPVVMTCTGGSGDTDFGYWAKACTILGYTSDEYKLYEGTTKVFYGLENYTSVPVYMQAVLDDMNGAASFWGTWNPH